jgi:hypothetical protein
LGIQRLQGRPFGRMLWFRAIFVLDIDQHSGISFSREGEVRIPSLMGGKVALSEKARLISKSYAE